MDPHEREHAATPASVPSPAPPPSAPVAPSDAYRDRGRLTRWLPIAANGGALIGLLLVVVQLQQNREMMRAQIRHELAMGIVDLLNTPAANPQLASVLRRGTAGDTLTPDERYQFRMRTNALLRYWEDVHYQYRQGLYDEVEYARQRAAWQEAVTGSVGLGTYWCEVRTLYSTPFAAELDSMLPRGACEWLVSPTPEADAAAEILALDSAWIDAEVRHDRVALERILDERFVVTFTSGRTLDRAGFIERIMQANLEPFTVVHERIDIHGDMAVVIDRSADGRTKYTWIAVRKQGVWRVVSETITAIAPPP